MIWLVKVKVPGIRPSRLPIMMNMNSENTKGKYFRASGPRFAHQIGDEFVKQFSQRLHAGRNERAPACRRR